MKHYPGDIVLCPGNIIGTVGECDDEITVNTPNGILQFKESELQTLASYKEMLKSLEAGVIATCG